MPSRAFSLVATRGTATSPSWITGVECNSTSYKVLEGRPNVVDMMKNGEIDLIINTPLGRDSHFDEATMRREATQRGISLITTLSGGHAMVEAIRAMRPGGPVGAQPAGDPMPRVPRRQRTIPTRRARGLTAPDGAAAQSLSREMMSRVECSLASPTMAMRIPMADAISASGTLSAV